MPFVLKVCCESDLDSEFTFCLWLRILPFYFLNQLEFPKPVLSDVWQPLSVSLIWGCKSTRFLQTVILFRMKILHAFYHKTIASKESLNTEIHKNVIRGFSFLKVKPIKWHVLQIAELLLQDVVRSISWMQNTEIHRNTFWAEEFLSPMFFYICVIFTFFLTPSRIYMTIFSTSKFLS